MYYTILDSPVGALLIAGDGAAVSRISFQRTRPFRPPGDWTKDADALEAPVRQLVEYFSGARRRFDLKLAPEGTPFQKKVWKELTKIPWGATISYGELARRVGIPTAARAVGAANGKNPIPIVIPCHRVIGANGSLTGFGGGIEIKERLLELEEVRLSNGSQLALIDADEPG